MSARARTLHIGEVEGRRFSLPLDLASLTMAVLGVRGSGKTNTVVAIVEEVIQAGIPCVIIDPTDVWWGLKSSSDGAAEGLPVVVFGGAHQDLPLDEHAGAAIADFVVANPTPVILSLRHLRKAAQRRFCTDFCEQLFHRKGEPEHRTPLFLAIDEASQLVPQRVGPEQARLVGAVQDIVRLGRTAGFGVALIDQRAASVNKDVLTQLELLVTHRITSPQDRKALTEWIQQHDAEGHRAAFLESLAGLPTGTAWFWSPSFDGLFEQVAVRMRKTFDSSRTPKIGERLQAPTKLAAVDLDRIRLELADAIASAEENDPKALRARIVELEREISAGGRTDPRVRALEEEVAQLNRDRETAVAAYLARAEFHNRSLSSYVSRIYQAAANILAIAESAPEPIEFDLGTPVPGTRAATPAAAPRGPSKRTPPRPQPPAVTDGIRDQLGGTPLRMLDALGTLLELGVTQTDRTTVAGWVGISAKSGTFRNYLSELRGVGAIEDLPGGRVALTREGARAAAVIEIPDRQALFDVWASKLGGTPTQMLRVLADAYPQAVSRESLASAVGVSASSGTFRNYLSELRRPGLIIDVSRTDVRASELLFPEGL